MRKFAILGAAVLSFQAQPATASYVFNCMLTGEVIAPSVYDPDSGLTYVDLAVATSEVEGRADRDCAEFRGQSLTVSFHESVRELTQGEMIRVSRNESDLADEVTRVYFFLND